MGEKHWEKIGSAENGEEWATAPFRVSVATELFGFHVAIELVAIENPVVHDRARACSDSALGARMTRCCARDRRPWGHATSLRTRPRYSVATGLGQARSSCVST